MTNHNNNAPDDDIITRLKEELMALEQEPVHANGIVLKPSQCYHLETDPPHVLFNTNCPSILKDKIQSILSKYIVNESDSHE